MACVFTSALLVSLLIASCQSAVIKVGGDSGWIVPIAQAYSPLTVSVGDTLDFSYPPGPGVYHNVWLMPNEAAFTACDFSTGAKMLVNNTPTYTMPVSAPGVAYYACSALGVHCTLGQKVQVTAVMASVVAPPVSPSLGTPASTVTPPVSPPLGTPGPPPPPPKGAARRWAPVEAGVLSTSALVATFLSMW